MKNFFSDYVKSVDKNDSLGNNSNKVFFKQKKRGHDNNLDFDCLNKSFLFFKRFFIFFKSTKFPDCFCQQLIFVNRFIVDIILFISRKFPNFVLSC